MNSKILNTSVYFNTIFPNYYLILIFSVILNIIVTFKSKRSISLVIKWDSKQSGRPAVFTAHRRQGPVDSGTGPLDSGTGPLDSGTGP